MILPLPKRWSFKPPVGTQIQWSSPLAVGLSRSLMMLEAGGPPRDLVTGLATTQNSTPSWVASPYGVARSYADSTPQWESIAQSALNTSGGTPFSLHVVFQPSQVTVAQWAASINATVGGGSPGLGVVTGRTSGKISYFINGYNDGATVSAGQWLNVLVTWDGKAVAGSWKAYVNGQLDISVTPSSVGSTTSLFLGAGFANSTGTTVIAMCSLWTRQLTAADAQQLYIDPYALLQPQSPQRRFWAAASAPPPSTSFQTLMLLGAGS